MLLDRARMTTCENCGDLTDGLRELCHRCQHDSDEYFDNVDPDDEEPFDFNEFDE